MRILLFKKKHTLILILIVCMIPLNYLSGCHQKEVFNFSWQINNTTWIDCYTIAGYGVWGGEVDEYRLRKVRNEDLKLMLFDADHEISDYCVGNDTLILYKYDNSKIKLDSVVVALSSFIIIPNQ